MTPRWPRTGSACWQHQDRRAGRGEPALQAGHVPRLQLPGGMQVSLGDQPRPLPAGLPGLSVRTGLEVGTMV